MLDAERHKPSVTERGQAWLSQFEPDDRRTAAQLLDAVRFVPGDHVVQGLHRGITSYASGDPRRAPVAAVPIMSKRDLKPLVGEELPMNPVIFRDFDPSQRLDGDPGSEAIVAHLIREMRRNPEFASTLTAYPVTLDDIQARRARTLLCVTDYIGSGMQVVNYVDAWHRHPTIRSWRSYGLLRIVVAAYAASASGLRTVRANAHVDDVVVIESAPEVEVLDRLLKDPKITELCRVYGRRARLGGHLLGYSDSGGLFASTISVPNNLPAILVRSSSRWKGFFDGRATPADLIDELGDYRPHIDLAEQLARERQSRLAVRVTANELHPRWARWIAVLALLPKTDQELVMVTGETLAEVRELRRTLVRMQLVEPTGALTASGRTVLERARRRMRRVTANLQPDPSPYYPQAMR